jgi:hypothetical protein
MNTKLFFTATMLVVTSTGLLGWQAFASTTEERGNAIATVAQDFSKTEAFVIACAQKYPATNTANQQAFKEWKSRNGLQDFERVLEAFKKKSPEIAQSLIDLRTSYVNLILKQTPAKLESICKGLPKTLAQPNSNTIKSDYANELKIVAEVAREMDAQAATNQSGGTQPSTQPSTQPDNSGSSGNGPKVSGTLYTLAQLSGLMADIYDGTKIYGQKDDAVEAKLKSLGVIYVKGTVQERHAWLGYEQGKLQSKYKVSCMDADGLGALRQGSEVIFAGRIDGFQSYFGAVLKDCSIITDASGLKASALPQADGLKRKPITPIEVMTKPGAGLKTNQIRAMYFFNEANNRMDGFGNPYVDVSEETFLVLNDGSVYNYGWSFPPEDFNVAASKREEPKAWSKWDGKELDGRSLEDFSKLLPSKAGSRLKSSYSLTATGAGGSLSERAITFTANGGFSSASFAMMGGFTQGGGVANSGVTSGDTTVTTDGAGRSSVATAGSLRKVEGSYSLEGYTLSIKASDGTVSRAFFGIPDYAIKDSPPKFIVLRGSMWFGP